MGDILGSDPLEDDFNCMPGEVKIENQAEAPGANLTRLLQARDEINNELVMRDKKMMSGPSDRVKNELAQTVHDSDNF